MSEHVVGLNCTNCGAKLDVYDDMERFACGYCGTEMIVQRRGGTVSLKSVTQAIKKVQIGTDKTAAELALLRLNEELNKLTAEAADLTARTAVQTVLCVLVGAPAIIIGLFLLAFGVVIFGLPFLVCGVMMVVITMRDHAARQERLATLNKQVAETKSRIEEQRQIVSSAG